MKILNKTYNYLKLIRVKHYFKNILILFPLIFSGNLTNINMFCKCFICFIIFSLLCSCIYVVNDIRDIEKDRKHFKKKNRPLASGKISIKEAVILIIFLLVFDILLILNVGLNVYSILCLAIYFILNILYSIGFKNIPIIDIIILVSGFVIRVLFGGFIINVWISNWLYLTIMSLAFYLALGKRRNEFINFKNETREVLKYYSKSFLDKNMYMCLSLAIVFYSLWTVDFEVMGRINKYLIWTVPMVIIICMRYSMIIESDSDGDPIEVIFNDKVLLLLSLLYGFLLAFLIYL